MDIVVRLSALGDIIHNSIILQFLPQKVDWLIEENMADILEFNPSINQLQRVNLKSIKKSKLNFFKEYKKLKSLSYKRAIDFQGLIKSAIASKIIAKETIGRAEVKESLAKLFYTTILDTNLHTIDRYRVMINKIYNLNIHQDDFKNFKPFLFYKQEHFSTKSFFSKDKKNIIFVIGASADFKIYPKEQWVKVANALQENILIVYGNKKEKEIANYIAKNSKYAKVLPKISLNELKVTISNANLVIGNDTGPTYIGWANRVPTLIIYGPVEANKVFEDKKVKFIKSTLNTNPFKVNKKDFSIKKLDYKKILKGVDELFS